MPDAVTTINGAEPARRTTYKVLFNAVDVGFSDTVDPSKFKLNFDDILTGSTGGKNKLGDRFVGVGGVVSLQLRQVNATRYRNLCPWAPATGSIPLTPPLNADMFKYSRTLTLHPEDMGTDTTEDLDFLNACPITLPLIKRDGKSDDVMEIDFAVYPSRVAIAANALNISSGSIGPLA